MKSPCNVNCAKCRDVARSTGVYTTVGDDNILATDDHPYDAPSLAVRLPLSHDLRTVARLENMLRGIHGAPAVMRSDGSGIGMLTGFHYAAASACASRNDYKILCYRHHLCCRHRCCHHRYYRCYCNHRIISITTQLRLTRFWDLLPSPTPCSHLQPPPYPPPSPFCSSRTSLNPSATRTKIRPPSRKLSLDIVHLHCCGVHCEGES